MICSKSANDATDTSRVSAADHSGTADTGSSPRTAATLPQDGQESIETPKGPSAGLAPKMQYLGQLPHTIDGYRDSAQVFYDLVKDQGWLGWKASRKCKNKDECKQGPKGQMVVQAIGDAYKVPVNLDASVKGVVVGQVYNNGPYDDATLPIPGSSKSKPDHYYLIVEPGTAVEARFRVAVVQFNENGVPLTPLTVLPGAGVYKSCGHPKVDRTRGYAAFSNCADAPPPSPTGIAPAVKQMTGTPADFTTAGLWMSCPDGCCSGGWPTIGNGRGLGDTLEHRNPRSGRAGSTRTPVRGTKPLGVR
jgi:hypothetical protein